MELTAAAAPSSSWAPLPPVDMEAPLAQLPEFTYPTGTALVMGLTNDRSGVDTWIPSHLSQYAPNAMMSAPDYNDIYASTADGKSVAAATYGGTEHAFALEEYDLGLNAHIDNGFLVPSGDTSSGGIFLQNTENHFPSY